ncbi:MAG: type II toxin-antitoxin system RelE/ParE family toxin [bacterium]|nr:type II toxin-antitoxin system RelE/ParE family toxin [bacterium]MCY3943512.1 type II toxin-antitoxin system RelE/ParE family toxin [Gemmatimonadota bacterium]
MAIEWTTRAIREIRRVSQQDRERVIAKIEQYAQDPSALARQVTPLTGSDFLRLRVGSHRVIFAVERGERTVMVVLRVRHRREAYEQQ